MLISKFNKLIRNKFVWAVFAILVSLSMVGLFAPQPQDGGEPRRGELGTLYGEPVSREALMQARLFVQSFQPVRGGEEMQRLVDEEAWRRLAAIRFAENLGLQVSASALIETIQRDPSFQENGVFSLRQYTFLIEQQLGVPVSWFEEYMRQEILLDRMRGLLDASLWIPASELAENAARFTDTYEVSYVLVRPEEVELEMPEVGEEAARMAYTNTPDAFAVPEQRRVVYATFPAAGHLDPDLISERQIAARYDADPGRFVVSDSETDAVVTQSLEQASAEIRMELAHEEALAVASEKAMELVDALSLIEDVAALRLDSLAAEMDVSFATSGWFSAEGPVPEDVTAGDAFRQAAFRLSATDPQQSFSFGVPGSNAVYVLQLEDVVAAHVPPFEEVAEDALALARRQAEDAALQAHVEALHTRISTALAEGVAFAEAAAQVALPVTEIKPFTLADADPREIPFFGDLAPDLLPLQTGDLTPPIETVEGLVIAYLQNRVAGAPEERLALQPDIASMMSAGLEQIHFRAWAEAVLQEARK